MKYFLLYFFFNFTLFSSAIKPDYSLYNKLNSQAIVFALDSNYSESFLLFKECFEQYDYIFPRDLLIAAQVAILSGESTIAKEWILLSIRNGINPKRIKTIPLLKVSLKETSLDSIQINRLKYFETYNDPLRCFIDSLYYTDQKYRDKDQAFLSNRFFVWRKGLRNKWDTFLKNSIYAIDSISKSNFPSERVIGIDTASLFVHSGHMYSMLYHYDSTFYMLQSNLVHNLKKGYIHIRDFVIIRDFYHKHLGDKLFYNTRWCKLDNYSKEEIILYNKRRDNINYFSIETEIKMKKAQNIYNYFGGFKRDIALIDYFYYEL